MNKPVLTFNTFNLKEVEKQTVTAAIRFTDGNIVLAQKLLKCSRQTIYRLLDEYGLYSEVDRLREEKQNKIWMDRYEKNKRIRP